MTRYRIFLEQAQYPSSTCDLPPFGVCNTRLPTLAFSAPDLAAGIRRLKGAKKHGTRVGNWLTLEQGRPLPSTFDGAARGKRDHAMVAVLLGCGLRRPEGCTRVQDVQQREDHWRFADLIGKDGHIRTDPIPDWVAEAVGTWLPEAGVNKGAVFRAIKKAGRIAPNGFSPKVIWGVVKQASANCGPANIEPHDLRRTCE